MVSRLGQLLLDAGVITPAQLDEALRAQVLYGGRLGTNLVDLDFVTLDELATALAQLHDMVPALSPHFERCDVEVQERLPPEFAAMHMAVPIGYLADGTNRIAVATPGPLAEDVMERLALYLGCEVSQIILAIAGELRLRFYLERCYGVARTSRYLRVRRQSGSHLPIPQAEAEAEPVLDEPGSRTEVLFPPPPPTASASALEGIPERIASFEVSAEAGHILAPNLQRRFVRTVSERLELDESVPDADAAVPSPTDLPLQPPTSAAPAAAPAEAAAPPAEAVADAEAAAVDGAAHEPPPAEAPQAEAREASLAGDLSSSTLGRMDVRRLARALPSDPSDQELETLEHFLRAIRRAQSRERIAELALTALARFSPAALETAVLFVVREHFAIGWKGIAGESDLKGLDHVAVDLQEPSLLATAHQRGELATLLQANDAPAFVDERLWLALATLPPFEAAACPVQIGGQSVCLYYVQGTSSLADALPVLQQIAEATAGGFARMFRAAQR